MVEPFFTFSWGRNGSILEPKQLHFWKGGTIFYLFLENGSTVELFWQMIPLWSEAQFISNMIVKEINGFTLQSGGCILCVSCIKIASNVASISTGWMDAPAVFPVKIFGRNVPEMGMVIAAVNLMAPDVAWGQINRKIPQGHGQLIPWMADFS